MAKQYSNFGGILLGFVLGTAVTGVAGYLNYFHDPDQRITDAPAAQPEWNPDAMFSGISQLQESVRALEARVADMDSRLIDAQRDSSHPAPEPGMVADTISVTKDDTALTDEPTETQKRLYQTLRESADNEIVAGVFSWPAFTNSGKFQQLTAKQQLTLLSGIATRANRGEFDFDSFFPD